MRKKTAFHVKASSVLVPSVAFAVLRAGTAEASCPLCVAAMGAVAGFFGASFPLGAELAWYGAFASMCGLWFSRKGFRDAYFKGRGTLWAMLGAALAAPAATYLFGADVFESMLWTLLGGGTTVLSTALSKYATFKRGKRLIPFQSSVFATLSMILLTVFIVVRG